MPIKFSFQEYKNKKLQQKIEKAKYPTKDVFHFFSFYNAFNGFKWAINTQPNIRVAILISSIVLLFCAYLTSINLLSATELIFTLFCIFIIFIAELLNTGIEAINDEVAKGEYKDLVRISKDVSSAAVTGAVILAFCVGLIIFLPKIQVLFNL